MSPVLPEELSAMLDGELDPKRAAELERQIANDVDLSAAFNALRNADDLWRSQADTARFTPRIGHIRMAAQARWRLPSVAGVAVLLVALRITVRGVDAVEAAFGLQAVVMVIILIATAAAAFPKAAHVDVR